MTIEPPLRNLDEGTALGSELTSSLRASGLWRSLAAINLLASGQPSSSSSNAASKPPSSRALCHRLASDGGRLVSPLCDDKVLQIICGRGGNRVL